MPRLPCPGPLHPSAPFHSHEQPARGVRSFPPPCLALVFRGCLTPGCCLLSRAPPPPRQPGALAWPPRAAVLGPRPRQLCLQGPTQGGLVKACLSRLAPGGSQARRSACRPRAEAPPSPHPIRAHLEGEPQAVGCDSTAAFIKGACKMPGSAGRRLCGSWGQMGLYLHVSCSAAETGQRRKGTGPDNRARAGGAWPPAGGSRGEVMPCQRVSPSSARGS